jgi:DNA-binding LytR/AlgR family response regulator
MRVVIIEDEALAAERLSRLIHEHDPGIEIAACLDSVQEAVAWFRGAPPPELAFFDIQLADGRSFEIFEQCEVPCPVIFTTAYDEYALRAFQVNSVDYLLKPIAAERLRQAFAKYRQLRAAFAPESTANLQAAMRQVAQALQQPAWKNRFAVKSGAHLHSIPAEDIFVFFYAEKIVWLRRRDGKKFAVDYTLEQLETLLDPARFFRINRQFIVSFAAIKAVTAYSNSRLAVRLAGEEELAIVSRERVPGFRAWLDGGGPR